MAWSETSVLHDLAPHGRRGGFYRKHRNRFRFLFRWEPLWLLPLVPLLDAWHFILKGATQARGFGDKEMRKHLGPLSALAYRRVNGKFAQKAIVAGAFAWGYLCSLFMTAFTSPALIWRRRRRTRYVAEDIQSLL